MPCVNCDRSLIFFLFDCSKTLADRQERVNEAHTSNEPLPVELNLVDAIGIDRLVAYPDVTVILIYGDLEPERRKISFHKCDGR